MLITVAGGGLVLDRSAAGLAVGLRRGVVGPSADIGDPRAGVIRPGDDIHPGRVRRFPEGVAHVVGGDPPCVRWKIDERVYQRAAGALLREIADEAVGVDPVRGAEIDHAEHRLLRKQPRGREHVRAGRLERGTLRERVPRVVVRHARKLGPIRRRGASFRTSAPTLRAATTIVPHGRHRTPSPLLSMQRRSPGENGSQALVSGTSAERQRASLCFGSILRTRPGRRTNARSST